MAQPMSPEISDFWAAEKAQRFPARFEWDDRDWSEAPRSRRPKEQRTDPSTVHWDGNVASGES